jgi:hypothetical protein
VSGRQSSREKEIDIAREDAARKAAMYHGVQVSSESVQSTGSGIFDFYVSSETNLDFDDDLEKYMDRLVYSASRDVITGSNGGVIIRFSYPVSFPGTISYGFVRNPNGRPLWINNPPHEINGFMAGVGFSGRQSRQRDTLEKSCNSAAADLVSRVSTVVTVSETLTGSYNTTIIHQKSTGHLENFLVLEVWIDPETLAAWTLAIAKKP